MLQESSSTTTTASMISSCFANYQPSPRCDSCHAIYQCIDATIEADGYYDELAEREEALWQLIEDPVVCASNHQKAMR